MKTNIKFIIAIFVLVFGCNKIEKVKQEQKVEMTAEKILGNPKYLAISYGGYRETSREVQPTIEELKEDLKILSAMGIKILRTYNVQPKLPHTANVLEAIHQLKQEDENFEMYVMLGIWIECDGAWTESRDHQKENILPWIVLSNVFLLYLDFS